MSTLQEELCIFMNGFYRAFKKAFKKIKWVGSYWCLKKYVSSQIQIVLKPTCIFVTYFFETECIIKVYFNKCQTNSRLHDAVQTGRLGSYSGTCLLLFSYHFRYAYSTISANLQKNIKPSTHFAKPFFSPTFLKQIKDAHPLLTS